MGMLYNLGLVVLGTCVSLAKLGWVSQLRGPSYGGVQINDAAGYTRDALSVFAPRIS